MVQRQLAGDWSKYSSTIQCVAMQKSALVCSRLLRAGPKPPWVGRGLWHTQGGQKVSPKRYSLILHVPRRRRYHYYRHRRRARHKEVEREREMDGEKEILSDAQFRHQCLHLSAFRVVLHCRACDAHFVQPLPDLRTPSERECV